MTHVRLDGHDKTQVPLSSVYVGTRRKIRIMVLIAYSSFHLTIVPVTSAYLRENIVSSSYLLIAKSFRQHIKGNMF